VKHRERREWNDKGFRDALTYGVHDPYVKGGGDSAVVEYDKGFQDGLRALQRIRALDREDEDG
jgi:hypothetical protein